MPVVFFIVAVLVFGIPSTQATKTGPTCQRLKVSLALGMVPVFDGELCSEEE